MLNNKQPIASFKDSRPSGELCCLQSTQVDHDASVSFGSHGGEQTKKYMRVRGDTKWLVCLRRLQIRGEREPLNALELEPTSLTDFPHAYPTFGGKKLSVNNCFIRACPYPETPPSRVRYQTAPRPVISTQ